MFSVLGHRKGILAWNLVKPETYIFLYQPVTKLKIPIAYKAVKYQVVKYLNLNQNGHYREKTGELRSLAFQLSVKRLEIQLYYLQNTVEYNLVSLYKSTKQNKVRCHSFMTPREARYRGQLKSRKNVDISNGIWWLRQV